MKIDAMKILNFFYPEDTPLKRLLLEHSEQVRNKALEIMKLSPFDLDPVLVSDGAMLHDIGIRSTHAPGILCNGSEPYIAHGILGADMLREYGETHGLNLEPHARICERHTGSGLSSGDVRRQKLPIPVRDYFPETPEEKLICLADKFFSKSGDRKEKNLLRIRQSMGKFGPEALTRFDDLYFAFFGQR